MKAFTFLELLLVISVATVVAVFTLPLGIKFFQTQTLDEATGGILETMRRSQNQAIFQKNDSAFGVKFLSGLYVLFQGNSYANRVQSEDETFTLSGGTTTSGVNEVVFAKRTGLPSIIGVLAITLGNDSHSIDINKYGKIERQ